VLEVNIQAETLDAVRALQDGLQVVNDSIAKRSSELEGLIRQAGGKDKMLDPRNSALLDRFIGALWWALH
jgi:hypothetical protein